MNKLVEICLTNRGRYHHYACAEELLLSSKTSSQKSISPSRSVVGKNGGRRLEHRQPHPKIIGRYVKKGTISGEKLIALFFLYPKSDLRYGSRRSACNTVIKIEVRCQPHLELLCIYLFCC